MVRLFNLLFACALLLCSLGAQAAVHRFVAVLDPAQATTVINPVPGANGTGSLFFDDVAGTATWLFLFDGLSHAPSAAHVHKGAPGVAGGVVLDLGAPVPFSGDLTQGVYSGSGAPPGDPEEFGFDLFDGLLYVNIHTPDTPVGTGNPAGEIRGQLLFHSTIVPLPPALVMMGGAVGLLAFRRRRG